MFESDNRAVSPVIGVILMVAITVILSATIGGFIMNFQSQVPDEPRAGVSFSVSDSDITVTWTSEGNVDDSVGLSVDGCGNSGTITSVGETITVNNCSSGDMITVTGETHGGQTGVVGQFTYQN